MLCMFLYICGNYVIVVYSLSVAVSCCCQVFVAQSYFYDFYSITGFNSVLWSVPVLC